MKRLVLIVALATSLHTAKAQDVEGYRTALGNWIVISRFPFNGFYRSVITFWIRERLPDLLNAPTDVVTDTIRNRVLNALAPNTGLTVSIGQVADVTRQLKLQPRLQLERSPRRLVKAKKYKTKTQETVAVSSSPSYVGGRL